MQRTFASLTRRGLTSSTRPLLVRPILASIPAIRTFSSGKVGEDSHSDFQKQTKAEDANENLVLDVQAWATEAVKTHPVLLFMKGSPDAPRCGYSAYVTTTLNNLGCEFASVDVLANTQVREGMKAFAAWPTFPMLFVGGKFIGGADVVKEMEQGGELGPLLETVGAAKKA